MSEQRENYAKKMQAIGLVLLTALFGGWLYYQSWSYSQLESVRVQAAEEQSSTAANPKEELQLAGSRSVIAEQAEGEGEGSKTASGEEETFTESNFDATSVSLSPIVVETDVYRAELSPEGAVMRSLILKNHLNNQQPMEMVRSVDSGYYPFTVYLGDYNEGQAVMLPFNSEQIGPHAYRFRTEFHSGEEGADDPYLLEKVFDFAQQEYMVKVSVRLQHKSGAPLAQNSRRVIYSLYYGPQIGPEVDHIGSNRTAGDTRSNVYFDGKKSRTISLGRSTHDARLDSSPIWAGISGKYFGVFALPNRDLDAYWTEAELPGMGLDASGSLLQTSQFLFERRSRRNDDNLANDTFYYYIGPLLSDELSLFNESSDNEFGLSDASLNSLVKFSLGFIEEPVKWILTALYGFTYNYGIAIILFALIVRILLYPLTLKAFKSTSRMRLIQPQMKELQAKYKGDPKRLQQEMAVLYRKEKVNPIGGCLPLLIQMPILIAIANLFYRYFELRGATFIPGWINDLSVPDLIYSLEIASWDVPLRLLPIIYLASQLVSSKLMQASQPPMQNKLQQRMFTVYMPIFFSVILYSMPSGLILYWTISNVLMTLQQLLMYKFFGENESEDKHEAASVIALQNKNYTRHTSKRYKGMKLPEGQGRNKGTAEPAKRIPKKTKE